MRFSIIVHSLCTGKKLQSKWAFFHHRRIFTYNRLNLLDLWNFKLATSNKYKVV